MKAVTITVAAFLMPEREKTAEILLQSGLYNNTFVKNIGFSESVVTKIHEWSK